ncbi:hypothetical protein [Maribacter sp. 2307ULW6-5]|uniref:hypothetical protein n=1 Tax=Maribacter sp. 2307ULW6-5 TaxID=3386275 RepID=UPI0039BC9602
MAAFPKVVSYIFHPLFTPMAGTLAYFLITPRYSSLSVQAGNLLPIFILTVIIPIIVFFILRNIGLVSSVFLPRPKERRYPLFIHICLLGMVLYKVIPNNYVPELYFYFVGLIAAATACFMLLLLNLKVSLHMAGIGALFMYLVNLSIHFEINIIIALSLFMLSIGVLASARLYLGAHNRLELIIGLFIGLLCQLLTIRYWL